MSKPVLLACLLVVLGACAGERLIGTAYEPGAVEDGGVKLEEERLVAAAKALEGAWVSLPNALFDPSVTLTFHHEPNTRGGTYELTCQGEKCFAEDAGQFSPLGALLELAKQLTDGEYKLFEINENDEAHGLLTKDTFGFFLYVPLGPGNSGIEVFNVPFVRPGRGSNRPGP